MKIQVGFPVYYVLQSKVFKYVIEHQVFELFKDILDKNIYTTLHTSIFLNKYN